MRFEAKFFNMHLAFQGKASLLFAAVVLALGAAATAAVCGGVGGFLRGALGSFLAGLAGIAVLGLVLFVGAACHMRVLLSKSKKAIWGRVPPALPIVCPALPLICKMEVDP